MIVDHAAWEQLTAHDRAICGGGSGLLDPEALHAIAAMPNTPARNDTVTHTYEQLSYAMRALSGDLDASWFCFAKYVSKQLHRVVTLEEVPPLLRQTQLAETIAKAFNDGNIAAFDAVVRAVYPVLAVATGRWPGRLPYTDFVKNDAQRVFLANMQLAHLEQHAVQPFVEHAIPVWASIPLTMLYAYVPLPVEEGTLRMMHDVPRPRYLCGLDFPAPLLTLTHPKLLGMAARHRCELTSTYGSGTLHWRRYMDRMRFTFSFFRAYQRHPALLVPLDAQASPDVPRPPTGEVAQVVRAAVS